MSKQTTLAISPDSLERFNWFKETYNHTDADVLLNFFMDKCGVPTLAFIRQWEEDRKQDLARKMKEAKAAAAGGST